MILFTSFVEHCKQNLIDCTSSTLINNNKSWCKINGGKWNCTWFVYEPIIVAFYSILIIINFRSKRRENILRKFSIFIKVENLKRCIFLFVASAPKIALRENDIEQIFFRDLAFSQSVFRIRTSTYRSLNIEKSDFLFALHKLYFSPTLHIHFPHSKCCYWQREWNFYFQGIIYGSAECCLTLFARIWGTLLYWTFVVQLSTPRKSDKMDYQ